MKLTRYSDCLFGKIPCKHKCARAQISGDLGDFHEEILFHDIVRADAI